MDSEILDQLTILEKNVDSEVTKPKRGCKKKADTEINELEESDIRDKFVFLAFGAWSSRTCIRPLLNLPIFDYVISFMFLYFTPVMSK